MSQNKACGLLEIAITSVMCELAGREVST